MITKINISGFKAIDKAELSFRPITVLTGENSAGKSAVLQSIFQLQSYINFDKNGKKLVKEEDLLNYHFKSLQQQILQIRNKNINAREIQISIEYSNSEYNKVLLKDNIVSSEETPDIDLDINCFTNLHYLSANRREFRSITVTHNLLQGSVDYLGRNTPFILTKNRNLKLRDEVCVTKDANTLDYQLDYWLSKILNQKISITTENREIEQFVTFYYSMNDLLNIEPDSVGTGQNHLVHILLMCLLAKKNEIVIIENPELHLHPKAQSALSEFFTMIANSGVQLILETHSEHIIFKFCHSVFKKSLDCNNIIIYYKSSIEEDFSPIYINKRGHYANEEGKEISFPNGFFDATLQEILEIS